MRPQAPPEPAAAAAHGPALLALWNDVDPALAADYERWHAVEHVPERLTVPGIDWALRWCSVDPACPWPHFLTLYGLRDAAVLDGPGYQRLLAQPTPMSRRMRPALRHVSRWVCDLLQPGDLAGAPVLVLRAAAGPLVADGPAALLARRRADAAPLPWLQAGQTGQTGQTGETGPSGLSGPSSVGRAVVGDWLWAQPLNAGAPRPAGAWAYRALPVGADPRDPA